MAKRGLRSFRRMGQAKHRPARQAKTRSGQVLLEPIERALPGELGGGLVVARRGVVMEAVIGAHIDKAFVRHLGLSKLLVEGRPARRDAGIELAVLRRYRRLDLGGVLGARLTAVEGSRGGEPAAQLHGQPVGDGAAEAEADDAELA